MCNVSYVNSTGALRLVVVRRRVRHEPVDARAPVELVHVHRRDQGLGQLVACVKTTSEHTATAATYAPRILISTQLVALAPFDDEPELDADVPQLVRHEVDGAAREIPATPRAPCPADLVDFHTGDELPEALITAVDVHQFDWRACVDGLVQADTPSDDDEA